MYCHSTLKHSLSLCVVCVGGGVARCKINTHMHTHECYALYQTNHPIRTAECPAGDDGVKEGVSCHHARLFQPRRPSLLWDFGSRRRSNGWHCVLDEQGNTEHDIPNTKREIRAKAAQGPMVGGAATPADPNIGRSGVPAPASLTWPAGGGGLRRDA